MTKQITLSDLCKLAGDATIYISVYNAVDGMSACGQTTAAELGSVRHALDYKLAHISHRSQDVYEMVAKCHIRPGSLPRFNEVYALPTGMLHTTLYAFQSAK